MQSSNKAQIINLLEDPLIKSFSITGYSYKFSEDILYWDYEMWVFLYTIIIADMLKLMLTIIEPSLLYTISYAFCHQAHYKFE